MATITETLARWAVELKYEDLTDDAVDAAKRFLYDSVGCALGGYQVHDVKIYLAHAAELGGAPDCTIIGSGGRANPVVATQLWYHVGSANEGAESRGLAHLFEHLMFGCLLRPTHHLASLYTNSNGIG